MRAELEATLLESPSRSSIPLPVQTPLILLGTSSVYAQAFIDFALTSLNVIACIDNLRPGQAFGGLSAMKEEALGALWQKHPGAVGVLCGMSDGAVNHFSKVWENSPCRLVNLFEVMQAHDYPGTEHYYDHFRQTEQIAHIYEHCWPHFTDAESQRSFLSVLLFRKTLAQHWLEEVRLPYNDMYFFTKGLHVTNNEVFVDAGSFDGDSLVQFLRRVGADGYRHIHAFEPDPMNFAKLRDHFGYLARSSLHECGLWSHNTQACFKLNGLGSHMDIDSNGVSVHLAPLDEFSLGPVTLLKMDIEGAEVPALLGAAKTIERNKPKLALAAYHKADDLPRLMDTVLSIRDDYRFTLSHHSPFFRDTVLMAT